ncbi:MAG: calcium/sodium antiporter [Pseudomonadota bacterium]|nr:calcium/sodium antiporter [Pseudomonadota bacterium]
MWVWVQLIVGFVLLFGGGEMLVRGSVSVARTLGVSTLVIGLTLVGFGTSMPEMVTCAHAALAGRPAIAVGNVIGSNIANILLIMGIGALFWPMSCPRRSFTRDMSVLLVVSVGMAAVILSGHVGRVVGSIFVLLLMAYTCFCYRTDSNDPHVPVAEIVPDPTEILKAAPSRGAVLAIGLGVSVLGFVCIMLGANALISSAVVVARQFGISEAAIGLSLVAIGTSLPELATIIMASIRRQTDMVFGNIIGSNIFNTLGILGTTAVISPLDVPEQIIALDIWIMLGVVSLLVLFARSNWRISRAEGGMLLLTYFAYMALVFGVNTG